MSATLIEKPRFPSASTDRNTARLILEGIGAVSTVKVSRLDHLIATDPPHEDEISYCDQSPGQENEDALRELTDEVFEKNPRFYLNRVTDIALLYPGTTRLITEKLLPKLLSGTPARRRLVHQAIQTFGHPKEILELSCEQYRNHGYEGRLTAAASVLSGFGADSWPVLRSFAKSGAPECEVFVELIVGLDDVPLAERLAALSNLATNGDSNTRLRVLEALEKFSLDDARPTLEVLAWSEGPQDSACDAAHERLQMLNE